MLKLIASHHQLSSALELLIKSLYTMVSGEADCQHDGVSFIGLFRFVFT